MQLKYLVNTTEEAFKEFKDDISAFHRFTPKSFAQEDVEECLSEFFGCIISEMDEAVKEDEKLFVYVVGEPSSNMILLMSDFERIIGEVNDVYRVASNKVIISDIQRPTTELFDKYKLLCTSNLASINYSPELTNNEKVAVIELSNDFYRYAYVNGNKKVTRSSYLLNGEEVYFLAMRVAVEDNLNVHENNKAYGSYRALDSSLTITENPIKDLQKYNESIHKNTKKASASSKIRIVLLDVQYLTHSPLNDKGERGKDFEYLMDTKKYPIPTRFSRKLPYLMGNKIDIAQAMFLMKTRNKSRNFSSVIIRPRNNGKAVTFWKSSLFELSTSSVRNSSSIYVNTANSDTTLNKEDLIRSDFEILVVADTGTLKMLDVADIYIPESFLQEDSFSSGDMQRTMLAELYKKASGDIFVIKDI